MVVFDLHIARQELAAHGLDLGVANQVGHSVDRVDMPMHQARSRVVYRDLHLTDLPGRYSVLDDLVAVVEATQDAGVEKSAVAQDGIADLVGANHGAGHGLFEVDHGHPHLGYCHRQIGMGITAKSGVGRAPRGFGQAGSGTDGDQVRATRSGFSRSIISR